MAAGALSFLASDALIGLQQAGRRVPAQETLIMAGYLLGQYLLAEGWLERTPQPPGAGRPVRCGRRLRS
ncbi:lysoplasmalogenase [Streptomyces albus]|uniref:lysoplasmalogenase n=1 Tax=Streptomyces albus TaxID=1888 RepID=UPI0021621874|nr:lysoplasmalogenase [Streptomyces albus]UVN56425.1 lysoplasmalogenase [Streptomyces albus]